MPRSQNRVPVLGTLPPLRSRDPLAPDPLRRLRDSQAAIAAAAAALPARGVPVPMFHQKVRNGGVFCDPVCLLGETNISLMGKAERGSKREAGGGSCGSYQSHTYHRPPPGYLPISRHPCSASTETSNRVPSLQEAPQSRLAARLGQPFTQQRAPALATLLAQPLASSWARAAALAGALPPLGPIVQRRPPESAYRPVHAAFQQSRLLSQALAPTLGPPVHLHSAYGQRQNARRMSL